MKDKKYSKSFKIIIVSIIGLISLVGVIYAIYDFITWKLATNDNRIIQEAINESVEETHGEDETRVSYDVDFKTLKENNPDTVAYLKVNNTNIDYVVVKGEDNDYYLKHNFERNWNVAGWIFADFRNEFDDSDKNIIIYGHQTSDGSMFGSLANVIDEKWYTNRDNHEVILVTESGTHVYKVFASYGTEPEVYYISTDFNGENEFDAFVKDLKSRSVYDYGVEVSGEDKILTLSSCFENGKKRVVLHAKLVEE